MRRKYRSPPETEKTDTPTRKRFLSETDELGLIISGVGAILPLSVVKERTWEKVDSGGEVMVIVGEEDTLGVGEEVFGVGVRVVVGVEVRVGLFSTAVFDKIGLTSKLSLELKVFCSLQSA